MTQSPRKRILSQIGSEKSSQKQNALNKLSNSRFQRLGEVFKFSPTHSREISIPQANYESGRSKYSSEVNCLEQLNSIFKLRKINNDKSFFQEARKGDNYVRSKSKINREIERSILYIQNIKNKRNFTESTEETRLPAFEGTKNNKQGIMEAIGLDLPELRQKKDEPARFVTEPSFSRSRIKEKKQQQIGLYSYLQRDFIEKKVQKLTDSKVVDYAKNPNNRNFHRIMLEKSRKFLKHAIEDNYRQVSKIGSIINQESKKLIQEEIIEKKRKYEQDYFSKNNVPYFSFLTLKDKERESVLRAINRKRSIS